MSEAKIQDPTSGGWSHPALVERLGHFVVKELLEGDGEGLEPSTDLLRLGLIDSMSIVMLSKFIEDSFGVAMPQDALLPTNLRSLNALADAVIQLQAKG